MIARINDFYNVNQKSILLNYFGLNYIKIDINHDKIQLSYINFGTI